MFDNYGHIHVNRPRAEADNLLVNNEGCISVLIASVPDLCTLCTHARFMMFHNQLLSYSKSGTTPTDEAVS